MSGFTIEDFGGIAPKIDAKRLGNSLAQTASDCLLDSHALEPLPAMVATVDSAGATDISLYKYNASTWLHFTNDRDFARAPIANDALDRIVYTDPGTYPNVYSAGTTYRLGIPAPAAAPTLTGVTAPADPNDVDAESISYVVTMVDAWGAEGPPSPPSALTDRVVDTSVTVNLPTTPVGSYNFGGGALKRIYRSNSGTQGANYQFVAEVAAATASYADTIVNVALGEILPSETWIGPPDDDTAIYPNGPMEGVVALPNGVLAGFAHKSVVFSEPFLYHAWPLEYRITFEELVVGITPIASGLLVVTEKRPYLIAGVHPGAMAVTTFEVNQACVAKRGMVDMGDIAIYPSPDGLVLVSGSSIELVTEGLLGRDDWQLYIPSTISAYYYEGKYLAFYNDGSPKGFIFDPQGGRNALTLIADYLEAAYYDALTDTLYVNDAGTIRKWGQSTSAARNYTWKSKKLVAGSPTNMGAIRIETRNALSSENVTVKVYADGTLTDTVVFNDSATPYSRLSGGFRAKVWELEITGQNPVEHVGIYETLSEAV